MSRSAGGRASQPPGPPRKRASACSEIGRQAAPTSSSSEKSSAASTSAARPSSRACQRLDLPAERAAGQRQRRAALRFGLGREQIGEPLGLGEVDPAILEGAAGELARLGGAQPLDPAERRQHRRDHRAAAMEMQLGDILAGRAGRARESELPAHYQGLRRPIAKPRQRRRRGSGSEPASACERRVAPAAR